MSVIVTSSNPLPPEILNAAGATTIGLGIGTSFAIENAGGFVAGINDIWEIGFVASAVSANPFTHLSP